MTNENRRANALCLMGGEEPSTHNGVDVLVHRDLVRTGRLDPDVARLFSKMQNARALADYGRFHVVTEAAVAEQLADAERFVEAARAILTADG